MIKSNVVLHPNGLQRVGVRIFQTAALALMVAMAIPACAADSRAVKSRIAPVYPEIARRMRISGEVRLQVTVDPDGKVTDVKKISGNTMLLTAAEDAVRRWRFESGTGNSTVEVSLNFTAAQ